MGGIKRTRSAWIMYSLVEHELEIQYLSKIHVKAFELCTRGSGPHEKTH